MINAQPDGNKGAEAMLEIMILKLQEKYSLKEIYIERTEQGKTYKNFEKRLPCKIKYVDFKPKNILNVYPQINKKAPYCVIDIGGISYHGKKIKHNLRNFLRHRFFLKRGFKLIFFTQDFGPTEGLINKLFVRILFKNRVYFFSRSNKSKQNLLNFRSNLQVLGPFPDSTMQLILNQSSKIQKKPYVCIAPSAVMYNNHKDKYLEAIFRLASCICKDTEIKIIVHCFTQNENTSDLMVSKEIKKQLTNLGHQVALVDRNMMPIEYKKILSEAIFNISSRYHVLVGSFSVGVPCFSLGWSHKYDEFLGLYELKHFNFAMDYVMNKEKTPNIKRTFASCEKLKNVIERKNISIKEAVNDSFSKLYQIIENK